VAILAGLRQRELQAGLDPLRAVMRNAQTPGELVGGLEPNPPHLGGQPVRLPADHLDRLVPVGLVDPHRQRRRHAHALEEDHHLLDGLLLGPGGHDHRGPLGTQTRHLDQPARRLLDQPQRVLAEVVNDPLGHLGTDPPDQPRTQIPADPLDGRREHGGVGLDLELAAVLGMAGPAAPQPQALPGLGPEQRADHGQQVASPVGGHPGHRIARLLVGVGDPLKHRLQRGRRHPPLLHTGTVASVPDRVPAVRPRDAVSPGQW
jgi:hypothetical protein